MAIVAIHENRSIGSSRINQFFGGKLSRCPFGFVPVTSENPLAFRSFRRLLADSAGKFLGSAGVIELYVVELQASTDEVNVGIVEAWQEQFSFGINQPSLKAAPGLYLRVRSNRHDPIT